MDAANGDRRQIAARHWGVSRRLAAWLVHRQASADAISLFGMAAALLAALIAAMPPHGATWLGVAALVQLRLLANMLDGMVALGRGTASSVGALFNEVPDRVSDTAILTGLGVAAGLPALGLGAALAALATAYVRVLGSSLGQPGDFGGPMAKQHRMAMVTAAALLCAAMPGWAGAILTAALAAMAVLSVLTALLRLRRLGRALRA